MIDLIIWSKDRAAQLHLLLDSIQQNMTGIFNPYIIYNYSNDEYMKGYDLLFDGRHCPSYIFDGLTIIKEENFRKDTMLIVGNKTSDNDFIAFSTDDTVLTRPAEFRRGYMDNVSVFSLRLGFNTTEQDIHAGTTQPPLNVYKDEGTTISWNFGDYHPHNNYGYPFGLDMHVYHREELYNLMKYMNFKNTNELETGLFHKKLCISPRIRSFKQSVAVNIPVNSITQVTRAGEIHSSTTEYLNSEYLKGRRLSLDSLSKEKIVGCHQEIKLEWIDG